MLLTTFASLLLAVGVAAVPPTLRTRATSSVKIYAYGEDIPGLEVTYDSDGYAMLNSNSSNAGSNTTTLAWAIDDGGDVPWNVTIGGASEQFYIVPTTDAFLPAGFLGSNETIDGAETLGFTLYGTQVSYISGSSLLSQFWAKTLDDGTFGIYWNSNGSAQADSVPVTLKTTSPTS